LPLALPLASAAAVQSSIINLLIVNRFPALPCRKTRLPGLGL